MGCQLWHPSGLDSAATDRELKRKGAYFLSHVKVAFRTGMAPQGGMTLHEHQGPRCLLSCCSAEKTPTPGSASWVQHGYWTKTGRKMVRQNAMCLVKFKVQVDSEYFSKYNYVSIIACDLFILKTGFLV